MCCGMEAVIRRVEQNVMRCDTRWVFGRVERVMTCATRAVMSRATRASMFRPRRAVVSRAMRAVIGRVGRAALP